jgi:guanylate kinase
MESKILIFSAPSGSGKTTIVGHLMSLALNLEFSISATSRKPRANEIDGVDYFFTSPAKFKEMIDNNEFLEWEEVYKDQFYGTLRSEVDRITKLGKHIVFDIDVIGGLNLKKEFNERALAVFVQAPSLEILEARLRARSSDSEEQLEKRIEKAKNEMKYAEYFDLILMNDDLNKSLTEAEKLITNFLELH